MTATVRVSERALSRLAEQAALSCAGVVRLVSGRWLRGVARPLPVEASYDADGTVLVAIRLVCGLDPAPVDVVREVVGVVTGVLGSAFADDRSVVVTVTVVGLET